jgi:hypothetical protein
MKITAQKLVELADTKLGASLLPELVRRLIRAGANDVNEIRFPSGESTFQPGADGQLHAKASPPYVPGGYSIWEFSVEKKVAAKLTEDFSKRSQSGATAEFMGVARDQITYVAVTLRRWTQVRGQTRAEFLKDARALNVWKGVEVLDADELEEWLDNTPSVAAWLAYKLGLGSGEVVSIEQFWEDYRLGCNPALVSSIVLAGRDAQRAELLARGLSAEVVRVKADSPNEAAAFIAASFLSLEDEHPLRSAVLAKGVVVGSRDALNSLAGAMAYPYVIAMGDAAQSAMKLAHQGFTAVVPMGNSNWRSGGASPISLPRARRDSFASSLIEMGLPAEEAERKAVQCNRSVTIFRRTHDDAQSTFPVWAERSRLHQLIGPIFAGAWKHTSPADVEVVATIGGCSPDQIEDAVLENLQIDDPPLLRVHDLTVLSAPADIWQIGIDRHAINKGALDRFRDAALTVLKEEDPALDLPPEQRVYASLHAKESRYSSWLRKGICETLRIIAVSSSVAPYPGFDAQEFVDGIVRELLGGTADHRLFASLNSVLPDVAEAAPRPFLQALGRILANDGAALAPLFEGSEDPIFGRSEYLGLLHSLEVLAWSPDYLDRATNLLARLAEVDPGGKLANRPINSLAEIFLPWSPHTNAHPVARREGLRRVCEAHPEIAWSLIRQLLPGGKDSSFGTLKPEWREFDASKRLEQSRSAMHEDFQHAFVLARELVGANGQSWIDLVTASAEYRNPDVLADILAQLESQRKHIDDAGEGKKVWEGLSALVDRHRSFADAEWAISAEEVRIISRAAAAFEPSDPIVFYRRLFDGGRLWNRNRGESFEDGERRLRHEQDEAAFVLAELGPHAVLRLASSLNNLYPFASALTRVAGPDGSRAIVLGAFPQSGFDRFVAVLVACAESQFGPAWVSETINAAQCSGASDEQIGTMIQWLDDKPSTLMLVEAQVEAVKARYWLGRDASIRYDDAPYIAWAVAGMSAHARNIELIDFVGFHAKDLPTHTIMGVLEKSYDEVASADRKAGQVNGYWLRELFKALGVREDVNHEQLMSLEYRWLPALHSYVDTPKLALHVHLAQSPQFFVEVLSDLYRSEIEVEAASGGGAVSSSVDASSDSSEQEPSRRAEVQARATYAYKLLDSWQTLSWRDSKGELDFEALSAWVEDVLMRARTVGREGVALREIGKLLAYAKPDGSDGVWPESGVRRLIECLASPELERAVVLELFNKRGVHVRSIDGGGDQERELAAAASAGAEALQAHWPRTAEMLRENAAQWRNHADWEDREAERNKLRN